MGTPAPGKRVRGSSSGRPIMALLDLLGRRMSLRILWELYQANGAMTFRVLETQAQTNPAVLNTRLKELREARLVEHLEGGYRLTPSGHKLLKCLRPLSDWSVEWANTNSTAVIKPHNMPRLGKKQPSLNE